MATNKRKDAAALFELIDKSTLKVPKNAGALKIPSWWSSKNNPPAPAAPGAGGALEDRAGEAETEERNGVQHKLFEPPPANETPDVSPTIRAPKPAAPVTPAVPAPVAPSEEKKAEPTTPYVRRPFIPQTMDPSMVGRRGFSGEHRGVLSRVPGWALMAAAGAVVLVLCLIIYLATRGHKETAGTGSGTVPLAPDGGVAPNPVPQSLLPPPRPIPSGGGQPQGLPRVDLPPSVGNETPGKVYEPATVKWSPDLYYVKIATTPSEEIARRNANFLAAHGIDIGIETTKPRQTILYVLIATKGFTTMVDAEPFRKKIVEIGHLLPEYKVKKRAWDDARIDKVTSTGARKP